MKTTAGAGGAERLAWLSDGYVTRESALGRLSVEAGKGGAGTQAVGGAVNDRRALSRHMNGAVPIAYLPEVLAHLKTEPPGTVTISCYLEKALWPTVQVTKI